MDDTSNKYQQLILDLKRARQEKHYTLQYIVDKSEELGCAVSMSTVRRIFGEGSETMDFRYTTLKPVVRIVLGLEEDGRRSDAPETGALRSIVDLQNTQIDEYKNEIQRREVDYQARIDYVKKQVEDLNRQIKWYKFWLLAAVLLVVAVLLVDAMFGNVGWFRW